MTKKKVCILFIMIAMIFTLAGCGETNKEKDSENSSSTYETPVEHFINAIQDGDYKEMKKAFPSFVKMSMDREDLEDVQDQFSEEFGEDYKITYKISDKEKLDEDDLEDMQEYVEDTYDEEVEITAGYQLDIDLKIKGSEGNDTDSVRLNVYEIDGSWYLLEL